MFQKIKLTEWNLEDNGIFIGTVKGNLQKLRGDEFSPLLERDKKKYRVLQVGRVNYTYLDQFIIKSMNDYYQRINIGTPEEAQKKMAIYRQLYSLWTSINQAKATPDLALNDLYDSMVYQLFLLGYKE